MPLRDGYYWNPEKCHKCGGRCCRLYPKFDDLVDKKSAVDLAMYSRHFDYQKVDIPAPRFDIDRAFRSGEEAYREELAESGVDISFCEYNHPVNGCIVPWENRPPVCKAYHCDLWEKTSEIIAETLGINSELFESERCWKDPDALSCGGDCFESCLFDEED